MHTEPLMLWNTDVVDCEIWEFNTTALFLLLCKENRVSTKAY